MSAESRPSRAARLRGIHSDLTSGSERTFHRGIRSAAAVLRVAAKILLVGGLVDVLLLTVVIDGSAGLALVLALVVLLLPAAFLTWHSRDLLRAWGSERAVTAVITRMKESASGAAVDLVQAAVALVDARWLAKPYRAARLLLALAGARELPFATADLLRPVTPPVLPISAACLTLTAVMVAVLPVLVVLALVVQLL
jgi:hypothetical protein